MLYWAVVFLVLAIGAAILGFGNIAAGATTIAQVLFFVFVVVFLASLVGGGNKKISTLVSTVAATPLYRGREGSGYRQDDGCRRSCPSRRLRWRRPSRPVPGKL